MTCESPRNCVASKLEEALHYVALPSICAVACLVVLGFRSLTQSDSTAPTRNPSVVVSQHTACESEWPGKDNMIMAGHTRMMTNRRKLGRARRKRRV